MAQRESVTHKPAAQARGSATENSSTSFRRRSAAPQNPTFATLARRISAWTTNLLAITIAIAIAVALGWQLMGWLREVPPASPLNDAVADLPPIDKERDFWTSGGLLKVQRLPGTPADALNAMRAFCRGTVANDDPRNVGPGEAAFVKQLLGTHPLEESPPLALYQPPGQAAMIVAIDRDRKQIVSWSFAMSAPDGMWSLYHFRPK